MNRVDIFALIDACAANPQRAQYQFYAPHILVLEETLARLRGICYGANREKLRDELVKIAAIAVRALEEVE